MPRTRNVTRSQWDTANASHASSARNRNENENGDESEKENAGGNASVANRLQSTRTSSRRRVLGATSTTVLGDAKGPRKVPKEEKSKSSTAPKRKKLPLQDITAQFLPAPEAANRGAEHQGHSDDEEDSELRRAANVVATLPPAPVPSGSVNTRTAPALTSPLPPSSPPSDLQFSPPPKAVGTFAASPAHYIPHDEYDPWKEFDNTFSASNDVLSGNDSNSDPFGFVALERKLKVERAHILSDPDHPGEELPGFGHILVADTSSPRPVRRLKRPVEYDAGANDETEHVVHHAHFATPPTPHKDKQKRRRLSHEGHDVFSVCSESIESSPSPSKVSARKRSRGGVPEDPLDEFNDKVDRSYEVEVASERKKQTRVDVDPEAIGMNLRTSERRPGSSHVNHDDVKKPKSAGKAKATKKPVKKPAKKEKESENENDEEDLDEVIIILYFHSSSSLLIRDVIP